MQGEFQPSEYFPYEGVVSSFIARIPGIFVDTNKWGTLERLQPAHDRALGSLGFDRSELWLCEQVHGADIYCIDDEIENGRTASIYPNVDGVISSGKSRALLGIYVADCAAIWLYDKRLGAMALLHSGKKGTEGKISVRALEMMQDRFGSIPSDVVALISPCVRPPHYEVDIASMIVNQLREAGLKPENIHDCGICTGSDIETYYSYRIEKGATGRMLALLGTK